eukprot:c25164_g24_i1 orf=487-1113(+)
MDGISFAHSNVYRPVAADGPNSPAFKFQPSFQREPKSTNLGGDVSKVGGLQLRDELPSVENLIYELQKCRKERKLQSTRHVHTCIHYSGLENHTVLGDYLVPAFVECGSVLDAQQVFFRLDHPNEYSWTSLIRGLTDLGDISGALCLYHIMQANQVHPTLHTFLALVQASARLQCMEEGFQIHAEVVKEGLEEEPFLGNALVDMYAKC